MRQFRRADRVGEEILRVVSRLFEGELSAKVRGMVTFTQVRLTNDLRYATVYYSVLGGDEDRTAIEERFQQMSGRIRHLVGRQMQIRHIPEFKFKYDPSVEEGIKIERLLNEIKSNKDNR
ncbi:MAG: 30S ribosome-binding factor RbfA [candidate division Zixibacteria bacterium]|nr:30S ribosome-binding factor RbfA [candidate division Zixibacteria bacterium]